MNWLVEIYKASRKGTRRILLVGIILISLIIALKWSGVNPIF
jgi:hypothetical protein